MDLLSESLMDGEGGGMGVVGVVAVVAFATTIEDAVPKILSRGENNREWKVPNQVINNFVHSLFFEVSQWRLT